MYHQKKIFLLTILLAMLLTDVAFGQRSKDKQDHHQNPIRKPKTKTKIITPVFGNNKYPYQGLGFKLGDPFALTYKLYFNDHFGIALDAGRASSGLYSRYFRDRFSEYIITDTLSSEAQLYYLTHKVNSDWVIEVKFLWHIDAKGITPGLRFYLGVGPEVKLTKIQYRYVYNENPNGGGTNELGDIQITRNAFGPQVIMGIEYSYFKIPISAFMEVDWFNDISLDAGWRRFEGGAGLRYIF